jgi:hypothetical protein
MTLLDDRTARRPVVQLNTLLPGSDRRRTPQPYSYRLTYRNPEPEALGCVMTWEVTGGRQSYQLALERDYRGDLRCHCTCADAIFRSGLEEDHLCKHVRGLVELVRLLGETILPGQPRPRRGVVIPRTWEPNSLTN